MRVFYLALTVEVEPGEELLRRGPDWKGGGGQVETGVADHSSSGPRHHLRVDF